MRYRITLFRRTGLEKRNEWPVSRVKAKFSETIRQFEFFVRRKEKGERRINVFMRFGHQMILDFSN